MNALRIFSHTARSTLPVALGFVALVTAHSSYGADCGLPTARPEAVGFSSERLERLDRRIQSAVDAKLAPGAVYVLARHGKVVVCHAYGLLGWERPAPMRLDSIFSLWSQTKPITAVAMMILYEEGKWLPGDPIARYLPELANIKVFAGLDSDGNPMLVEARHPPTVGEVLTQTGGFVGGFFHDTPVGKMLSQDPPLKAANLTEYAQKLAKVPLLDQPGERWDYPGAFNSLGLVIERTSGLSVPDFMRQRIFGPLKMRDTGFLVAPENLERLATHYPYPTASGRVEAEAIDRDKVTHLPRIASVAAGLYATVSDYARFCQMLLNGGELNGVRILSPSSIELMRTNHLDAQLLDGKSGVAGWVMQPGLGYGYGVGVYTDPARLGYTFGKGTYFWGGGSGPWVWIDPVNDLFFVGMIQRDEDAPGIRDAFWYGSQTLTYQALLRP